MKRKTNFFHEITALSNLKLAHKKASQGKSHYRTIKKILPTLDTHLHNIMQILEDETYTLNKSDYHLEIINDKGKERELYKLDYYPHRIIQWSIMNIISDTLIKNFTADTYASIKNKGIHNLGRKLKIALRNKEETTYCLKLDIEKFYPSIDNQILFDKLKRKFKDAKFLRLMRQLIFSLGEKGQPIGSLLSQYLANFYLSSFDHFCKETLQIKYYFRYMDDIVVLHHDKSYLHNLKTMFDSILDSDFKLKIKENWQVFKAENRGIDYVGYRFFHNTTILRKRIFKKAKKVIIKGTENKSFASYYGWLQFTNLKLKKESEICLQLTQKKDKLLSIKTQKQETQILS